MMRDTIRALVHDIDALDQTEAAHRSDVLDPDEGEFVGTRWWPFDAIVHAQETRFDPHLPRFIEKLSKTIG